MKNFHPDRTSQGRKSLEELREVIGDDATEQLVARYGGLTVAIPKSCNPTRSKIAAGLIKSIGEDAARRLCLAFADTRIYIPKRTQGNEDRDAEICTAYDNGSSVDELALAHCLTSRRIREILNS